MSSSIRSRRFSAAASNCSRVSVPWRVFRSSRRADKDCSTAISASLARIGHPASCAARSRRHSPGGRRMSARFFFSAAARCFWQLGSCLCFSGGFRIGIRLCSASLASAVLMAAKLPASPEKRSTTVAEQKHGTQHQSRQQTKTVEHSAPFARAGDQAIAAARWLFTAQALPRGAAAGMSARRRRAQRQAPCPAPVRREGQTPAPSPEA